MNTDFARRQMITQQIRTWDVRDERILDLFADLARDAFVPASYRHLAYADCAIPIGHGQQMLVPSVEGRLLQGLDPQPHDDVLEIGTGSGWLTACLARLAGHVVSIDIQKDFTRAATTRLAELGAENTEIVTLDACRELPEGPFDVIAVSGSLPAVDQRFLDALKPGGRLFLVNGERPVMNAQLIVRDHDDGWRATTLFETSLARLQNAPRPAEFSF